MPGLDGLEAIRAIRTGPAPTSQTPVILVTADVSVDLEERSRSAGANRLLRKPVMMTALFDAVATVLSEGAASIPLA